MACRATLNEDEKKLVCMFVTCFYTNKPDRGSATTVEVSCRAERSVHEQNEVETFGVIGGVLYIVRGSIASLC